MEVAELPDREPVECGRQRGHRYRNAPDANLVGLGKRVCREACGNNDA